MPDSFEQSPEFIKQRERLLQQANWFRQRAAERKSINILWISCSSVNKDDNPPRIPSSQKLLERAMELAPSIRDGVEVLTKIHKLNEIDFQHCEANYSIKGDYCTRPCWISQRMAKAGKADPLTELYYDLVDWADIVLIATPIRWNNPTSLYFKLVERLNCIENQKEVYWVDLIHNQLVGMIIVGAQDGAQHVMGQIMSVWSQMWFSFAKNPAVAYTAGWYTNKKTELVSSQIETDQAMLDDSTVAMLTAQIESVLLRRK